MHHWSRSYDIWFLRYNKQRTKFFVIMGHFLTLLTTQKIKILKKCKKLLEILWFCTKIMMYDSWDIGCNRQIFSHFVPFFALLLLPPPFTTQTIKILQKWKKTPRDIIILHKCTIIDNHMIYRSWDINCNTDFFCHLGPFFTFYPPNCPKNENIKKKLKNTWRCHHFTQEYQKSWSYAILFLKYGMWQM